MPKLFIKYIAYALIIMVLGFGFGYVRAFLEAKEPPAIQQEEKPNQNVSIVNETKLAPEAKLVLMSLYSKCGHELKKEETIKKDYAGYTKEQFAAEFADWEIEKFTPTEVVLKRYIDDICEEHYFIGLKDGYVTLFQGIPELSEKIIEITDIMADTLREEDLRLLEKGMIISSQEEFLQIKEGLTN